MANATSTSASTDHSAPDSDVFDITGTLDASEFAILEEVRAFMLTNVAPIINDFWLRDAFPFELLSALKDLDIGALGLEGRSQKLIGMVAMEMARVDPSFATFFGIQTGLAMGSIALLGSEEQKQQWLPAMGRLEKIGCFGLTEPEVGSGTSGGLLTTARRDGNQWVLNGQKKWIGNAPWCDLSIIWARDLDDNQVKGFIVENKTAPGFSVEKIANKMALKVVQNGLITLNNCRVPDTSRLRNAHSFRDTARVLRATRSGVGWMATGLQMGACDAALTYCRERMQFGRPLAAFQMIQDLIARMFANATACQTLMLRLAEIEDSGKLLDQQASLAKAFTTLRMRETVAWAREIHGANGILVDSDVGRLFADAEALDSYEGTYQMQNLIVGKAVTGISAFV